jgi:hypothetical protein
MTKTLQRIVHIFLLLMLWYVSLIMIITSKILIEYNVIDRINDLEFFFRELAFSSIISVYWVFPFIFLIDQIIYFLFFRTPNEWVPVDLIVGGTPFLLFIAVSISFLVGLSSYNLYAVHSSRRKINLHMFLLLSTLFTPVFFYLSHKTGIHLQSSGFAFPEGFYFNFTSAIPVIYLLCGIFTVILILLLTFVYNNKNQVQI